MFLRPTEQFCQRARMPYPSNDLRWDPYRFTFKGLHEMLEDMIAHDVQFVEACTFRNLLNETHDDRLAHLIIPVRYSLEQAKKIGAILTDLRQKYYGDKPLHATFIVFEKSPLYKLKSSEVAAFKDMMRAQKFAVINDHYMDVSDSIQDWYVSNHPNVTFVSSQEGVYGGPMSPTALVADATKKKAIIELAEHAYSEKPLLPAERLVAMPELSPNQIAVLKLLNKNMLGTEGTREYCEIGETSRGARWKENSGSLTIG